MGEPESTPGTWKLSTPVGFPVEVPADCAGAGVVFIPNRCPTLDASRCPPVVCKEPESRTSSTISYTTTTNPAEPLARLILQSAAQSASPADVRRVANVLEHVASAARNDRPTADVFRDAQRRLADLGQPVFGTTSNVVSETVRSTPDHVLAERKRPEREFAARQQPGSAVSQGLGASLEFVPVESYDDYVKHVLEPARGSYSRTVGDSWGDWNNARVVRTPAGPVPRAIVTDNGTRGRYFPDDLEQQVAEAEQQHKVVGRFVDGRFVATEDSTPVEPDALDRLNDQLDELERERELTGNTTTTSTTSTTRTTEPGELRLGPRAFDALRGPFDASARLDEPVDFWIWSPALDSWVVGCGFVILVGAEQ